jgi:lipoyl(octanoyl) transferase
VSTQDDHADAGATPRSPLADDGPIGVAWLGTVPYAEALELQERLRDARIAGRIGDTVLLLQHPAVYTRGRRATPEELPMGADWYAGRGIEIVDVRRGGKVTFHGPGQLVAYVVVRTGDVIAVVRALERAMVAVARERGVDARGRNDEGIEYTGVWVEGRKVGSIGLHLSRGVTTHGVGLNVVTDLAPFGWIVPCGLTEPMTSLARETGAPDLGTDPTLDADAAVRGAGEAFAVALGRELGAPTEPRDAAVVRAAADAASPAAG